VFHFFNLLKILFCLKGSFLGWPKYVHTMDFHFQEIMAFVRLNM
jgi:hypothetical protein